MYKIQREKWVYDENTSSYTQNGYEDIYDQSQVREIPSLSPKCSVALNEPGSLNFTVVHGNPLVNSLQPMDYVRAIDDGVEIFSGRIIQRSKPTLRGDVSFQCEGALAFLLDSEVPPYGKDSSGNVITRTLTAEAFFRWCISQHNDEVNDYRRQFTIGTVSASSKSETAVYSITSYTKTKDAIESHILNIYGGFLRVRPKNGGGHYIDWIENYDTVNPQAIAIGINLEDQTNETDATDMFTVLRPVGKDGLTLPEETFDLYPAEKMAKYGRIVKTIEFKNADSVSELRSKANQYKNRIQKTLFTSSNIRFVDMHYIDGTTPKIRLGDRFTNIVGLEGTEMIASSMELNFDAPQNDTLDLRNRKSLEPDLTTEGNRHASNKSKSLSRSHAGSGSQFFKYLKEYDDTLEVFANKVYMHGETLEEHYQSIIRTAGYVEQISSRVDTAEGIITAYDTRMNDIEYHISTIEGTAVIQNSQSISEIAGKFEIWTDQSGNVTVHLKNGAEMAVDGANGSTITVGEQIQQLASDVNGLGTITDTLTGSALWTQRDQITGVCGEYEIQYQQIEDPEHPGQQLTIKTLVVKSGGGLKVRKDGVEYGVYDQGNLTGGLLVNKINGQSVAKLRGDVVDIQAEDVHINASSTLDTITGHFEEETYPVADQYGNVTYKKRLVYVADAGMMVRRKDENNQTVTVGLYDEGNLTGGLIVQKINGQSAVLIRGSHVLVGNVNEDDLETWAAGAEGLIAAKATINDLNAVSIRVQTLESDYINTNNLSARLSDLNVANINRLVVTHTIDASGYIYGQDFVIGHDSSSSGQGNKYVSHAITAVQIDGPTNNNYKLQYKRFSDSDWQDAQTFSRAVTSWTLGWSGGTFTAKANPQNQSCSTTITQGETSWNGNNATVPINAADSDNPNYAYATGRSILVDASGRYNAGKNDGYSGCHLASSWGTGNDSNKLIISKTTSGSDNSLTFTITANSSIAFNSSTNKFTATGKAKVDGTEKDNSSSSSGELSISFNNIQGSGASSYRTVSVKEGNTAIITSGNLTDYGDGYEAGYSAGWDAACALVTRSGNQISGPVTGKALATSGRTEVKFTANYTASSHSYTASSYTASSYTASSYTKESHSYTASSYTASSHSYTAATCKLNNGSALTKYYYNGSFSGSVEYNPASHSYTPSTYRASAHSYTASKYTASSYSASSYTKESHSYTASSFSWS